MVSFFNRFATQIAVFIAIGLIVLAGYLYIVDRNQQIDTLKNKAAASEQRLEQTTRIIQQVQTTEKVNDHIQAESVIAKQAVSDKQDTVVRQVRAKVVAIKQAFTQKPATPAIQKVEANEISRTRIEGLWSAYCLTDPVPSSCQQRKVQ